MGLMDIFKGFGKIAQDVAPLISMFNPAVGAGFGIGGNLAQGNVGGAVRSGVSAGFNKATSGVSNFLMPQAFGATGSPNIVKPGISNTFSGIVSPSGRGGGTTGTNVGFGQPSTQPGGGIFDMFKGLLGHNGGQTAMGVGSLAAGLLKGYPKVPQTTDSLEQLRSSISNGGSALGQFGQQKLQGLMGENFQPMSEPEIQASLRQLEQDQVQAEDQVRDLYRNLRPGSDPSSDAAFRRDLQEVQDQFARAKSDTVANRTRDLKQNFDQNRLSQIQTSLGASSQEMQQLTQLAQLDINQIMAQLGLDAQQAQIFKETFLDLGASLLNPQPNIMELFAQQGGQ